MKKFEIAVYGASGHTGRMVSAEARRRGASVRNIGRRQPSDLTTEELSQWRTASCDDAHALDHALEGVGAVINCAGPFIETAPALIEAALRAGAHYFDITAEQRSARQSLATYDEEARHRGVAIVPAMAFYGGLADLLAGALCKESDTVDEILIGMALDSWHPTIGTRRTGERNTARRLIVRDGRLVPSPSESPITRWKFPAPFGELPVTTVPLAEIVTIHRHLRADRIESFMNIAPLQDLDNGDTPPPSLLANGKSDQQFAMDVTVTANGSASRVTAVGEDIYGSTAPIVVEACLRVLCQPPARGGAFAPAHLFDCENFLAALGPSIRIERHDVLPAAGG